MDLDFKIGSRGLCFDFYNQWKAVLSPRGWNWIDFTFIHVSFEHSPYKYSNEFCITILGLGLIVTLYQKVGDMPICPVCKTAEHKDGCLIKMLSEPIELGEKE